MAMALSIPPKLEGKHNDLGFSMEMPNYRAARELFIMARERIVDVNGWSNRGGIPGTEFQLCDGMGNQLDRSARDGDFIRIDLPGPGPASGGGYDWVKVEDIGGEITGPFNERFAMRVRSCAMPGGASDVPAHFFDEQATSTFMLEMKGRILTASYHGRNEIINTKKDNPLEKARNLLVGAGGLAGMSELQWQGLIKGFLENGLSKS